MAKYLLMNFCRLQIFLILVMDIQAKDCPSSTKMYTCSPICYKDSDCASIGGKCCSNLCNQKSCVPPHMLSNSGDKYDTRPGKYDSSSVYCGNVKCSSFEKCEVDRTTKREKCVRA